MLPESYEPAAQCGNVVAAKQYTRMNQEKIVKQDSLQQIENHLLQLVEEAQLRLIRYPDQRDECRICFSQGKSISELYIRKEDCPMSAFRELAMHYLLKMWAEGMAEQGQSWVPCAALSAHYLRKLPEEIRPYLSFHKEIARLYEQTGDARRAVQHRLQSVVYQLMQKSIDLESVEELSEDALFDLCIYVVCHVAAQGCFGKDNFYDGWQRQQYDLLEYAFSTLQEYSESNTTEFCSLLLFLKGVYLKRTRRFALAEETFLQLLALPEADDDERFFDDEIVFALLGECCLHAGDKVKADAYFHKATSYDPPFEELNEMCMQTVFQACYDEEDQHHLQDAIDVFFGIEEVDDAEEGEEDESEDTEYTFDDWYEDAENGDVVAQLVVGHCYYMGNNVHRSFRLAKEWFSVAAQQGDPVGQCNLAYMYEMGIGTEVNLEEAARWKQKAETNEAEWQCMDLLIGQTA